MLYEKFTDTRQILAYSKAREMFNLNNFTINPIPNGIELIDHNNNTISMIWNDKICDCDYIPF